MELFEAHAHYDDEKFDIDRDIVIPEIYKSGITKIVSAGYSLEGTKKSLELSRKYEYIYSTAGISPNDLGENWKSDINEIRKIVLNEKKSLKSKIVAIGEIGLDYHYDTDREIQKEAFIRQIQIANEVELPIVIHTRDAVMDTIQILKENKVNKVGIFHCCPFNRELVKEALKLGFYISISGTVTFKNAKNAEEIVKMVPEERILIETDSPYLSPEPLRGKRNDSRNLKYTIQKIAQFKGKDVSEMAEITYKNAKKIYEL